MGRGLFRVINTNSGLEEATRIKRSPLQGQTVLEPCTFRRQVARFLAEITYPACARRKLCQHGMTNRMNGTGHRVEAGERVSLWRHGCARQTPSLGAVNRTSPTLSSHTHTHVRAHKPTSPLCGFAAAFKQGHPRREACLTAMRRQITIFPVSLFIIHLHSRRN
jgi:hypothetical protein